MLDLWRISDYETLNGQGGFEFSARWNTAGRPLVYLAASPAGALLEVLVHLELEQDELPDEYTLLHVQTHDTVSIHDISPPAGDTWKSDLTLSRSLGDQWLRSGKTALARIPSSILPETWNYLLNPMHGEAASIRVVSSQHASFDMRLLGLRQGRSS